MREIFKYGSVRGVLSLRILLIRRGSDVYSTISIIRNPILASICKNILPYSGYGSGIKRVLEIDPTVEFINDIEKEEFRCIILRKVKNYESR